MLTQTALFEPKGVWGPLYWYLLYPIHLFVFSDLAQGIVKEAQRMEAFPPPTSKPKLLSDGE